ncbi:MAG TPA: hypothetical protein VF390_01075 [Patescibacteria group bacterium]
MEGKDSAMLGCLRAAGYTAEEAEKNIAGNWTRDELRQSAKYYNASTDPAIRAKMLRRFLSAKHVQQVKVSGLGVYIPERISDLRNYFSRSRKNAQDFSNYLRGKVAFWGSTLSLYDPPISTPDRKTADSSKIWRIPLEKVGSLVFKKNGIISIKIQIS